MTSYREHAKALTLLGIPIVLGQLGAIAQSFADTIMVGQYGTDELSASGFVNNVFNLAIFFLLGVSYSTTPVVGRFFGQGRLGAAYRSLRESIIVNLVICGGVMLLMFGLYSSLDYLNQPTQLLPLIRTYFIILLLSLPFMSAFNAMKQFCDGVGDTKSPMWILLMGNALNIGGNALLIYGCTPLSIPSFGLAGAGYATLISRIAMMVAMAITIRASRHYHIYHAAPSEALTNRGMLHIARKGVPIGLQLAMEASAFNIAAIMMGWLGATALAAHQVMGTIASLCFMVYYGIGAAAAIRISHFRGKEDWAEVKRTAYAAYAMTLAVGALLTAAIYILRIPLAFCFTTSAEVVEVIAMLMLPFVFYQFGDCAQIVFANSLRAIERVKPLVWGAIVAYWVISLPLSYLLAFTLDVKAAGIWWGFPFGLSFAGLVFFLQFRKATTHIADN